MAELSIIIPFYNSSAYIGRCIKSFLRQKPELLEKCEFIFVDDGSTDNSCEILRQEMSREFVLINQVNKRQGGARNAGLQIAKGRYIWFVDSDDEIADNALEKILQACAEFSPEILFFGITTFGKELESKSNIARIRSNCILKGLDYIKRGVLPCGPVFVFLRKMLVDNSITFVEGVYFEDNGFMVKSALFAQKVVELSDGLYIRHETTDSSSRGVSSGRANDLAKSYAYILSLLSYTNKRSERNGVRKYAVMQFNSFRLMYRRLPKNIRNKYRIPDEITKYSVIKNAILSFYPKYIFEAMGLMFFWGWIFRK